MRPVERPSTVPPCLLNRSSPPSTNDDEENEDSGVRTRRSGRKNRLRWRPPSASELNSPGGNGSRRSTPIRENGSNEYKRTTPQRNAKNRKRNALTLSSEQVNEINRSIKMT